MNEPLWLRGAAVAAALAGIPPDEAGIGFEPAAADAIGSLLRAHAEAGSPAAIARAIATAHVVDDTQSSRRVWTTEALADLGALVAAAMLRSVPAAERAALGRALDTTLLRRAAARAATAPAVDGRALAMLITRSAQRLGRMPSAQDLGGMALAALGYDDARVPPAAHATLRTARSLGIATDALFGPLASQVATLNVERERA